jgi:hypothetical protein
VYAWSFSSSQYVQAAVKNMEGYLAKPENGKWKIPSRAETPTQTTYRPELDVGPELSAVESAYYQSLIGVLRWIVELARVDICLEVSMTSSHLALPREGHLAQVLHIFAYLKKYHNTEMVFDPSDPVIDQGSLNFGIGAPANLATYKAKRSRTKGTGLNHSRQGRCRPRFRYHCKEVSDGRHCLSQLCTYILVE